MFFAILEIQNTKFNNDYFNLCLNQITKMTSTLSSSPLIQKPDTQSSRLSLRIVEQLKGLTFFLMRPLRKKAALILILVASILYCIVSVTQFHLFAKINKKSEVC